MTGKITLIDKISSLFQNKKIISEIRLNNYMEVEQINQLYA